MLLSTLLKLAMTSPTVTNRADECLAGARPKCSETVSFGLLQCDFKSVAPLGSGVKAVEIHLGGRSKRIPWGRERSRILCLVNVFGWID